MRSNLIPIPVKPICTFVPSDTVHAGAARLVKVSPGGVSRAVGALETKIVRLLASLMAMIIINLLEVFQSTNFETTVGNPPPTTVTLPEESAATQNPSEEFNADAERKQDMLPCVVAVESSS